MRRVLLALLASLTLSAALAVGVDNEILKDPAQEARARILMADVRCLVCQNQTIAESEAPVAKDLRRFIREHVAEGASDETIRSELTARYGDWILMETPLNARTLWLWALPILLLLIGTLVALRFFRNQASNITGTNSDEEAAVNRLLKGDEP